MEKIKPTSRSHDPSSPTDVKKPSSRIVSKSQDIHPERKPSAVRVKYLLQKKKIYIVFFQPSNSSARARRREKKEMEIKEIETPRMKSSVDIDPSRRSIDVESRSSSAKNRPNSAKAALESRSNRESVQIVKRTHVCIF